MPIRFSASEFWDNFTHLEANWYTAVSMISESIIPDLNLIMTFDTCFWSTYSANMFDTSPTLSYKSDTDAEVL